MIMIALDAKWRLVTRLLGLPVQQSQQIFGGPFEFVLQAKAGARYFISKNWGLMFEGGYEHVSNADIYPRNVGVNQFGGRFGIFCMF
jgi:hypothetical protein